MSTPITNSQRRLAWPVCIALTLAAAAATPVAAQTGAAGSGPMTIERSENGWSIAPDVKFTHFDHDTRTLAGVYGGATIEHQLFLGLAGYWLTDPNHDHKLSYGGALVEWREGTDRPIGFSVKGLLGFGSATVDRNVTVIPVSGFGPNAQPGPAQTFGVPFREDFLVAEPQADLIFNMSRSVRLHAGVGYRAVSGSYHDGISHDIQGATGSISLEIGSPSRP